MEYIRTFSREFELPDGAELSAEIRSGALALRGDDTNVARVEVVARLWAEDETEADEQAELIDRGISADGKRLSIRSATLLRPRPFLLFGRGARVDYQLTMPRATRADVNSRSGRVEIQGVAGPVEIEARSGAVALRDIERNVKVSSHSGGVQAEAIGGSFEVASRSGSVRVTRCEGDVKIQIRSGSFRAEDLGGKLEVETRSGAVRYDGAVRDAFDIDVRSGAIRLTVDPNSVFFLDAETASGNVRSDLPLRPRESKDGSNKGPTVRLRTSSGSITIVPR